MLTAYFFNSSLSIRTRWSAYFVGAGALVSSITSAGSTTASTWKRCVGRPSRLRKVGEYNAGSTTREYNAVVPPKRAISHTDLVRFTLRSMTDTNDNTIPTILKAIQAQRRAASRRVQLDREVEHVFLLEGGSLGDPLASAITVYGVEKAVTRLLGLDVEWVSEGPLVRVV